MYLNPDLGPLNILHPPTTIHDVMSGGHKHVSIHMLLQLEDCMVCVTGGGGGGGPSLGGKRGEAPGGGGVLSLEKGTDCGPTAGELWLS